MLPSGDQGQPFPDRISFLSSPDFQDMSSLDVFLKDDNASVSSSNADSAYQSQPDATQGSGNSEIYQKMNPQDSRNRMGQQYPASDIYSPSMSSDNFSAFQETHSDMNQMFLPSAATDSDLADNPFRMADYSTYSSSQTYNQFPSTTPTWGSSEVQTFGFNFNPYSKSQQNIDGSYYYASQGPSDLSFNPPTLGPQRQLRKPQLDTAIAHPKSLRSNSSLSVEQLETRRTSTHDSNFGTLIMSPNSGVPATQHHSNIAEGNYEQLHFPETKGEKEEISQTNEEEFDQESLSVSDAAAAQSMEEEQGKVARSHALYQAQPDDNGEYHCPQEGKSGCTHKPTKLKCNYDKYVDSHLRPFRCKVKSCIGVQFSSTACLLRHEREAHGMHGHGSKPHLCEFADCERSVPGNGFPRRYNLYDHMKRVHDYTGPTSPHERSSQAQQSQPGLKRQNSTSRKRKATTEDTPEKRQKSSAKPTPQALAAQQQLQQRQQLQTRFKKLSDVVVQALTTLNDPKDLNGLQLTENAVALSKIAQQLKGLG